MLLAGSVVPAASAARRDDALALAFGRVRPSRARAICRADASPRGVPGPPHPVRGHDNRHPVAADYLAMRSTRGPSR